MPTPSRKRATTTRKTQPKKPGAAKPGAKRTADEPASLLIRGIDPEVARILRDRAKRSGRSLQQELHLALRRDAKRNFDEAAAIAGSWHERLRGRKIPDTAEALRRDRSR